MGNDDVNLDLGYISQAESLANYAQIGSGETGYDSTNGVYYTTATEGGYYKTILRNIPSGDWYLIGVGSNSPGSITNPTKGMGIYIKLNDGFYYIIELTGVGSTLANNVAVSKQASRPATSDGAYTTIADSTGVGFSFFGLKFESGGAIKVFNDNLSYNTLAIYKTTYPAWSNTVTAAKAEGTTATALTWSGEKIVEIGFIRQSLTGTGNGKIAGLYLEGDSPSPSAGDMTLTEKENIFRFTQFVGTYAHGEISMSDPGLNNITTHLANYGAKYQYYMRNGNLLFEGEMRKHLNMDANNVKYEITPAVEKLAKTRITTSSKLVADRVLIGYDLKDSTNQFTVYDRNETFSDYSSRVMIMQRQDQYVRSFCVNDAAVTGGLDHPAGDYLNLYFNPDTLKGDYTNNSFGAGDSDDFNLTFNFYVPTDSFANIKSALLNLQMSIRPYYTGTQNSNPPELQIYNFQDTAWETIYTFQASDFGSGNAKDSALENDQSQNSSPMSDNVFDLVQEVNDWWEYDGNLQSVPAIDNMSAIRLRVELQSNVIIGDETLYFWKCMLDVTYNTLHTPTVSSFDLDAPGGTDDIPITVGDNPIEQHFGVGDIYSVVYFLKDYLSQIFTDLSFTYTLDEDITNSATVPAYVDYENRTLAEMLDLVCTTHNAVWWIDFNEGKVMIRSTANLTPSGLTFTKADSIHVPKIDFDSDHVASTLLIKGALDTYPKSVTTDFTPDIFEDTFTYEHPYVYDYGELKSIGDNMAVFHASIRKTVVITLNANTATNGIKLGSTVTGTFTSEDGTNIVNDTLMIAGIDAIYSFESGHKEFITLTLVKRY